MPSKKKRPLAQAAFFVSGRRRSISGRQLACALALRDRLQAGHRLYAGLGGFLALLDEVLEIELPMLFVLVEMMGREHRGKHRHAGVELHPHQPVDDGLRHEIMAVDAAVDHKTAGHDARIPAGTGQDLCVQGDFVGTGQCKDIDLAGRHAQTLEFGQERGAGLCNDVAMLAGVDERKTFACQIGRGVDVGIAARCDVKILTHG